MIAIQHTAPMSGYGSLMANASRQTGVFDALNPYMQQFFTQDYQSGEQALNRNWRSSESALDRSLQTGQSELDRALQREMQQKQLDLQYPRTFSTTFRPGIQGLPGTLSSPTFQSFLSRAYSGGTVGAR